jgi:hypothetical protein
MTLSESMLKAVSIIRNGRDHTSILTRLPLTPESPSIVAALLTFSEVSVGTAWPLPELLELLELVALDADEVELAVLAGAATGWNV